jgi:branched-chain amino acid transport system substrate-binding protein
VGIIGTSCSSAAVAALPIINEAGLVMISGANTSPRLTTENADAEGVHLPAYFRTAHNDLFQGALAAQFAINVLGAETLATVHDGSAYANSLQQVMAENFDELGGEVLFQGAVNVGDTDMSAILTEIAANPPDVLYMPIFEPEINFIVDQAKSTPGLEDTILFGADAAFVDGFVERTGEAALGMYLSSPLVTGERYDALLETWDEVIGGIPPSGFHAHAYDATNILFAAIEAVAVVADDGSISIGRQALRDAIAATENFDGITGSLTCLEEEPFVGDCATGEALAIYEITEAEMEGNWPPPVVPMTEE